MQLGCEEYLTDGLHGFATEPIRAHAFSDALHEWAAREETRDATQEQEGGFGHSGAAGHAPAFGFVVQGSWCRVAQAPGRHRHAAQRAAQRRRTARAPDR